MVPSVGNFLALVIAAVLVAAWVKARAWWATRRMRNLGPAFIPSFSPEDEAKIRKRHEAVMREHLEDARDAKWLRYWRLSNATNLVDGRAVEEAKADFDFAIKAKSFEEVLHHDNELAEQKYGK